MFSKKEIEEKKDTITATYFVDSSKIEYKYYLGVPNDLDSAQTCNKVEIIYSCHKCFNQDLKSILKVKRWKKLSETEFVTLQNKGKIIYFGPPKKTEYIIEKLTIVFDPNWNDIKINIQHQTISKEEFKRYKKIKNYR